MSYPKFKKKRNNFGSYYLSNNQAVIKDRKYLRVPNLGLVKMRKELRFNGKINSYTISQKGDKFFVSISMQSLKKSTSKLIPKLRVTIWLLE